MDLTFSSIMAGIVFGALGVYLIKRGRGEANPWSILIGAALLIYPYFVPGDWLPWLIGLALLALAYVKR